MIYCLYIRFIISLFFLCSGAVSCRENKRQDKPSRVELSWAAGTWLFERLRLWLALGFWFWHRVGLPLWIAWALQGAERRESGKEVPAVAVVDGVWAKIHLLDKTRSRDLWPAMVTTAQAEQNRTEEEGSSKKQKNQKVLVLYPKEWNVDRGGYSSVSFGSRWQVLPLA